MSASRLFTNRIFLSFTAAVLTEFREEVEKGSPNRGEAAWSFLLSIIYHSYKLSIKPTQTVALPYSVF